MFGAIMTVFAIVVLCIFPLVYDDFYFNILETKYQFYCVVAIGMMVVMLGYGLVSERLVDYVRKVFGKEISIKGIFKAWSVADWAVLVFWFSNVMSWIFCTWRWEAFWGTSGRYNGVFLMTVYAIVYFLVTRFYTLKRWHLDAFLAVGLFVCLFGITDHFKMDILGFKEYMLERQKGIYTSTIGNVNTYTIYAALYMTISMILFAVETKPKKVLYYYISMVIAAFALIMGLSENAYLSLAVLFGLSPLYLFRTKTGTSRYLISLATFLTVIPCIAWADRRAAGSVVELDGAFQVLANMKLLPVLVIGMWGLAGIVSMLLLKKKKASDSDEMPRWLCWIWYGVIAAVVGAVAFAFYDATVAGNSQRYGALAPYVTFTEEWGTDRGYVWRKAIELWRDTLTPIQKIFGYGADTFLLLMEDNYEVRMLNGIPTVYDSAHNEYLHFLVTIGVSGMVSYIVWVVSSILAMCKRVKCRPEVAAVLFAVTAYAVQATVNINLPVAMPVLVQLLAMGLSRGKVADTETEVTIQ